MSVALLFSLGTFIVRIQSVRINFARTRRLFNLPAEAIIKFCNERLCVYLAGAQDCLWRSNKLLFLVFRPRGLHLQSESKINSSFSWRCLLSWQKLFQQRDSRISWGFCNNSEVHIWLWKMWSLIVCSQGFFYVTVLRKDDKNR